MQSIKDRQSQFVMAIWDSGFKAWPFPDCSCLPQKIQLKYFLSRKWSKVPFPHLSILLFLSTVLKEIWRKRIKFLLIAPKVIWMHLISTLFLPSQVKNVLHYFLKELSELTILSRRSLLETKFSIQDTMMTGVITSSLNLKAVCVCVCVPVRVCLTGFVRGWCTLSHDASHGSSLVVRNEYLPMCLRFNCHIVTLFKAT